MGTELDPREAAFEAQIETLRRQFLRELPDRRATLVSAWRECADLGDEAAWLRLRDVAHKLSGSAPNYGLDAVGDAARALDKLLSGRNPCRGRGAAEGVVARLMLTLDETIEAA